ncbi:MAG: trehalose-phosphatase [Homoserinimonas sp.]|jgi:trehalose 6-phosphate phosphatase|nr:trehalose-phosphatase [Homoserinimonas sp.]
MAELGTTLAQLARTDELLVALDFDGTLAPMVDDPQDARALPAARDAILLLMALPRTRVALISGRAMGSLVQVSDLPETALLIGSHGVEVRLDAEPALTLDADEAGRVHALRHILTAIAQTHEGVWVEAKPAGFALHTRLANSEDSHSATERALAETEHDLPGLTVRRGTNVLEFSVRATNKGDAIRRLREFVHPTATLFAGDDVTDEDAFAVLEPGDLGLKCGAGETAADHRVANAEQVAEVLEELARLRREETGQQATGTES